MLAMLLLAQMTAWQRAAYLLGVAPTCCGDDPDDRVRAPIRHRPASMHGMLATVRFSQVTFFIVIWVGLLTACFRWATVSPRAARSSRLRAQWR